MKKDNQFYLMLLAVMLLVLTVAFLVYNKNEKEKEKEKLLSQINQGIGENANDIDIGLSEVTPDFYPNVLADANRLWNAKGFWNDDEDEVFEVLRGKSKRQLSALSQTLQANRGVTLNAFLEDIFGDWGDAKYLQRAKNIINSAR
jgi:hypothetical protein